MTKTTKIHTPYRTKNNVLVPGVTTITNLLGLNKGALIHWAWKMGTEGEDYRKVRDKAGDIGSITHYLIECDIKGIKPDLSGYVPADVDKAENGFLAFLDWKKRYNFIYTPESSERQLVSEKRRFGGTLDWTPKETEERWLIDFKTGKGLYEDMKIQVAAYKNLWNEIYPEDPITRVYILRLDNNDGSFHPHKLGSLNKEWGIFKHLVAIYYLRK